MAKTDHRNEKILSENLFPVVGIGASAGGLESFKALVKAIPENSGIGYILIQHLAPQVESMLSDILQKVTTLPVVEITDNLQVRPDHIYVIPSNKVLTANDGILQLEGRIAGERLNSIDVFFTSLAEIHLAHAIGVILSGTGSDGTVGLKTIKDQGGITIAQDTTTAAYAAMPQSAIDAEVVDYVLSPGEIPGHLINLLHASNGASPVLSISEELKDENTFRQIVAFLKTKHNVDFTYYKKTTFRRRTLRRKALSKAESLKDYYALLVEDRQEQEALLKDVLIPVTAFFRDPETFDILCTTIFPQLFSNRGEDEPIRIWVAGCSTGEEAYSIAICLYEYLDEMILAKKIQIFATDISEFVIAKARNGIYHKKDMAGISDTRIKRFFTRIDGSFQINKEIRQMCVFACHNLLTDPPFAKLDFVSCRNVLIYMEPYLQKKVFNIFHYSLHPKSFLLLGKSETPGNSSEQFQAYNQKEKIYRKKEGIGKSMQVTTESGEQTLRKSDDRLKKNGITKDDFGKAADEALLAKYGSVGVVVNEQLDILQFRGVTSAYLESPAGNASLNLLKMARNGLAFELRAALHAAKISREVVKKENVSLDKSTRKVDIEIIPLHNTIDLYFLVLFSDAKEEPETIISKSKRKQTKDAPITKELLRVEHLEKELSQVRDDMRSIIENQEAANEELQSANEELLSGSEELQSLNEELETSKEEIQSSNEELTSLNAELIERNEQLNYYRKYAEAIVSTIHESLIVLTKDFQIKSANKCFYEKFSVNERQTEGKMFFEWGEGMWNVPGLVEALQKILPSHSYLEKFEITVKLPSIGPRILLLNARQIINITGNEELILLAIHDITDQKIFEQALELKVSDRTRELQEANRQLQFSNENLQQFASIASHDLQEPLRKIRIFTSILSSRFPNNLPKDESELVNKINISAERMSQLIKEVLQYSKVAQAPKDYVETNLDIILKNVLVDLDLLLLEYHGTIVYEEALPTIDAVPLQMNQLFYNLLSNALKFRRKLLKPVITISWRFLPAASMSEHIELAGELPYLEIKFIDNGIGFEQEFAEQIFQLFERLNPAEEYEGTGLGLTICKKVVENHNGKIYAISKESEGACFYVILPARQMKAIQS